MVAVIGIDPGLVDTGLVYIELDPYLRSFETSTHVVHKLDLNEIETWVKSSRNPDAIFVEAYRPRSNFGTDQEMVQAVGNLHRRLRGSTVLNNTGVKKVIKKPLLELLGLWSFQATHHQDLRSAARIGLYGLIKNPDWNPVLAQLVRDYINGDPWTRV